MPSTEYIQLREEIAAKSKQLFDITSVAGPELDMQKVIARGLVPTAKGPQDVVDEIRRRNTELNALAERFEPYREAEAARTQAAEFQKRFNEPLITPPMPASDSDRPTSRKTLGQQFVASKEYQAFRGSGIRDGDHLSVELAVDPRATLFETTAGFSPESVRSGRLEYLPMRPIAVIDHIPQIPIGQAADVYMEETTATEAAAERAEGAAAAEAAFVWTERTETVRSVDVSLPVTREQLEDVAGMEGILDNRLVLAVQRRVDLNVLAGTGTAPQLKGTENVVGIQSQAKGTDNLADAVYKLLRKIRDDGFAEPEIVFIRDSAWEPWRLAKTTEGIYLHGSPADAGPDRLWGVPVLRTNAVTSTKAIAGAYRAFSALRTRTGFSVETGWVNDQFNKRQRTLLAGVRVAMVHYRPKAFGQVTGL